MVLAGLRPDTVLDISARALAFWSYQVKYFSVCMYKNTVLVFSLSLSILLSSLFL